MQFEIQPKVSILLPCYNAEKYLASAIESILNQSYPHFELLFIDDASQDNSLQIARSFPDSRIRIYQNTENKGIVESLNILLENVSDQTTYIARMDADDLCAPDRLAKQVEVLEKNPAIVGCGCYFAYINTQGENLTHALLPITPEAIHAYSLFTIPFCHATVMIRKNFWLVQNQFYYQKAFLHAEDYELFTRMLGKGKFYNLPEILYFYRKHTESISYKQYELQKQTCYKIHAFLLQTLQIAPTQEELELHYQLTRTLKTETLPTLKTIHDWLLKIYLANQKTHTYPFTELETLIKHLWYKHTAGKTYLGVKFGMLFAKSPFSVYKAWNYWQKIKFWLKCILRIE